MNLLDILNEPLTFEEKLEQTKFFINQLQKIQNEYFNNFVQEFQLTKEKSKRVYNFIFNNVDMK